MNVVQRVSKKELKTELIPVKDATTNTPPADLLSITLNREHK